MTEQKKVPGLIKRVLRKIDFEGKADTDDYMLYEEPVVAGVEEANVMTSVVSGSHILPNAAEPEAGTHADVWHAPVIDLDFPCELIPSSTPGHFHLVIDKKLSWAKYSKLLDALADAGLVEEGYANASLQRGYTSIRLPWVKRQKPRESKLALSEEDPPAPESSVLDLDDWLISLPKHP